MWLRSFGVLSAAVLFTNGIAFGQDAVTASGGGGVAHAYDWLSPAPLAWTPVNFNWADLPVKVFAHESGGYNSNIYNLSSSRASQSFFLPKGQINADYFSRIELGASTKIDIESQKLFVDYVQSTTNYIHDRAADIHNHTFDGGVNWRAGSHCDGKLMATSSVLQALQVQAIGPGIDNVTTQAFNETGQCHFYQDISAILNSDAISTRHSLLTAKPLDNNTTDVQGGLQYQWPSLDNLQAMIKYTNTNYIYGAFLTPLGLTPHYVHLINYGLTYNNQSSQLITYSIMGGFTQSLDLILSPNNTTNGKLQPVYSVSLFYNPTPKWTVTINSSRTVSPPNTLITNSTTQTTTTQAATLTYAWTPKLSLSASLGLSTSSAPGATRNPSPLYNSLLYGPSTFYTASIGATYTITPFTSLVFSLNQSKRQFNPTNAVAATSATNGNVNTSIVMIGLDYRPH
jgi:hypothetical protein